MNFNDIYRDISTGCEVLPDTLLDRLPVACCCLDARGSLVACNEKWSAVFGLEQKQEAIGRFLELLPERQPSGVATRELLARSAAQALKEGGARVELLCAKADGRVFCLDIALQRETPHLVVGCALEISVCRLDDEEKPGIENDAQLLLDAAPMAISIYSGDRKNITCNQETLNMFGLESACTDFKQIGKTMPAYQPDGRLSMEIVDRCMEEALRVGRSKAELVCVKKDGTTIYTEVTWARVKYKGDSAAIVEYVHDITAVKIAAVKEREASELARLLMEAAPYAFEIWDDELNLIYCNGHLINLLGLSNKEEYIRRYDELSPEFQPCGTPSMEKARYWVSKALEEGYAHFEWMHTTLKGEPLPTEVTFVRATRRGRNMIVGYANDLRDIKKAMESEREAYRQAQALIDATPFIVNVWDDEYNLVRTNRQSAIVFGLENQEQYIERFSDLSPECQPCGTPSETLVINHLKEAFRTGFARFEWMHQTLAGEQLPTEITLVRIEQQGRYVVLAYTVDLRPIKKAMEKEREAEEESRAKSRFLARMSHEIRTPMNAVLGIAEIMLQKETHPPETEEAFLRIHSSSSLLLTIINDILDIAKVEAGKMEILPAAYAVESMIVDTVQLNLMHVGSKNIGFELAVSENLPTHLMGDELRIKQILNNLLSNAFKYTQEGLVTLSLDVESAQEPGEVVLVIRVTDTGQGMNEEQLAGLFTIEFARYNMQSNRMIEGSGLGLHIAYQLIQMMQGSIEVDSAPHRGTTFIVRINQKPVGGLLLGKEAAEALQNLEVTQKSLRKMSRLIRETMPYGRVLVVDDVESNLYVAQGILMPYKLTVETADSGYEAVERIKNGEVYDIIFMDHMMPGMDGVEAVKRIRAMGYMHPIVALTANTVKGAVDLFMSSGFSGFVSKPIDVKHIDSYLVRYIRNNQSLNNQQPAVDISGEFAPGKSAADLPERLAQSFLRDAAKAVGTLEAALLADNADSHDLKPFNTAIHAIKSALVSIGLPELSGAAYDLEKAAQVSDLDAIKEQTPRFLERLRKVVDEVAASGDREEDIDDEDPAFLREQLLIIAADCEAYNKAGAKKALRELGSKRCSKQTKALLGQISAHLLHGDFEECAALIRFEVGN